MGRAINGAGSVRKRETGRGMVWDAQASVKEVSTGRPRRVTKRGFKTQKEAMAWCRKQQQQGAASVQGSDMRVGKAVEAFLAETDMTTSTAGAYKATYTDLARVLDGKRMRALREEHFRRVVLKPGLAKSTSIVRLCALRKFGKWAVRKGVMDMQVYASLEWIEPRGREAEKREPVPVEDLRKLLAVDSAKQPLWLTLAATGIRLGEAQALRPQSLTGDTTLLIDRAVKGSHKPTRYGPPKSGRSRNISAPGSVIDMLRGRRGEALFGGDDPWSKSVIYSALERDCKQAGIPAYTPHQFRHTWATEAFHAGVPGKIVQEQLGHTSIAVTLDTYTSAVGLDTERAVTDVMGRYGLQQKLQQNSDKHDEAR